MLIVDWLRWQFTISGIVVAEERGRLSWLKALGRLFSGGVKRNPDGPSINDLMLWQKLGKPLHRYHCRVCGVHFWGWKKRKICYKFSCWRQI